jgi:glycerophosphoryl diester phosphodiesterase
VQLLEGDLDDPLDEEFGRIAEYAVGIGPPRRQVDSTLMTAARRHGLIVHPYTVNEPAEMVRLLDLGVDGLFTDRPDRLVELLRER